MNRPTRFRKEELDDDRINVGLISLPQLACIECKIPISVLLKVWAEMF
jgi:hypothetical protein